MDINGYPLILTDTAGLRKQTSDVVEQEGIKRALQSAQTANLIIFVVDVMRFIHWRSKHTDSNIEEYFEEYICDMGLENLPLKNNEEGTQQYLYVMNKSDLITDEYLRVSNEILHHADVSLLSCENKNGLVNFVEKLTQSAKKL